MIHKNIYIIGTISAILITSLYADEPDPFANVATENAEGKTIEQVVDEMIRSEIILQSSPQARRLANWDKETRAKCIQMLKNGNAIEKANAAIIAGIFKYDESIDLLIDNISIRNDLLIDGNDFSGGAIEIFPCASALLRFDAGTVLTKLKTRLAHDGIRDGDSKVIKLLIKRLEGS